MVFCTELASTHQAEHEEVVSGRWIRSERTAESHVGAVQRSENKCVRCR